MTLLDPFYPIVDSCDWLARLLPCGIKQVQLRIKNQNDPRLRAEISSARDLCKDFDCQLIVNDYWQLAIDLHCDFVHLGQEDLDHADIQAIRKSGLRFGVSTHSHEELNRALSLSPDYIALGPVYPTTLKKMPWAPQGLSRVREWKDLVNSIPLVGIGGITLERANGVLQSGADAVSVISDIIQAPSPEDRTRCWLETTETFRKRKIIQ